jgi:hypothetical protein
MLTLDIDQFMLELDRGTLKHVGASKKAATVKLYDTETVDARAFGDRRVKLACKDDGGNEVELALDPEQARSLARELERLENESPVFE